MRQPVKESLGRRCLVVLERLNDGGTLEEPFIIGF